MQTALLCQWLADAVLASHAALAAFVVLALPMVLVGNLAHWRWVNRWGFRLAHLALIGVIVAESCLGIVCPLTTLEMFLREKAHEGTYAGSFIEHWLQRLLFYQGPPWVFTTAYAAFGAGVLATWWFFPPRRDAAPAPAPALRTRTP